MHFCTLKRGFTLVLLLDSKKDRNTLHSHRAPFKSFHRCCFQMKKCFLKCPLFPFPKHEKFWLAGWAIALATAWVHQAVNPLLDLPLPTSFSVVLGSFPADTTLSVGSAHKTEGSFVSTANIIHYFVTKGQQYLVPCKHKDTFLNRECRLTASLRIKKDK